MKLDMALITSFEERPLEPKSVHAAVLCGYRAVVLGGERLLQLETYGSPDRAMPGKVSQSIQLNQASARALKRIIDSTFPGI